MTSITDDCDYHDSDKLPATASSPAAVLNAGVRFAILNRGLRCAFVSLWFDRLEAAAFRFLAVACVYGSKVKKSFSTVRVFDFDFRIKG